MCRCAHSRNWVGKHLGWVSYCTVLGFELRCRVNVMVFLVDMQITPGLLCWNKLYFLLLVLYRLRT